MQREFNEIDAACQAFLVEEFGGANRNIEALLAAFDRPRRTQKTKKASTTHLNDPLVEGEFAEITTACRTFLVEECGGANGSNEGLLAGLDEPSSYSPVLPLFTGCLWALGVSALAFRVGNYSWTRAEH